MGYSITKSGIHNSTGNNNRNGGRSTNNSKHEMNGAALVTRPFCFHNLSNTTLQYADDSAMTAQRPKPIINSAEAGTISFGLGHLCRALGLCETCAARTLVSAHVPQGAAWPVLHTLCSTHGRLKQRKRVTSDEPPTAEASFTKGKIANPPRSAPSRARPLQRKRLQTIRAPHALAIPPCSWSQRSLSPKRMRQLSRAKAMGRTKAEAKAERPYKEERQTEAQRNPQRSNGPYKARKNPRL